MALSNETLLQLHGTHEELWQQLEARAIHIRATILQVHGSLIEHYPKREIRDYEAAFLWLLARQYDYDGALIVEIGTCWGWTAAVMQSAAPRARVLTCTPNHNHVIIARRNLATHYPRVDVFEGRSLDLLPTLADGSADMVFVDGDHQRVANDLPFYNKLKVGGLMVHHDYCPEWCTGPRPCRWVYETVNDFSARLAHEQDVLLVDHSLEGMAGHYRREGETWPTTALSLN